MNITSIITLRYAAWWNCFAPVVLAACTSSKPAKDSKWEPLKEQGKQTHNKIRSENMLQEKTAVYRNLKLLKVYTAARTMSFLKYGRWKFRVEEVSAGLSAEVPQTSSKLAWIDWATKIND